MSFFKKKSTVDDDIQTVTTMNNSDVPKGDPPAYIASDEEIGAQGEKKLKRKLDARHVEMIAIGGTIGTGLFMASGVNIAHAGPVGALIGYAIGGLIVYSVVTSLGEMATLIPISGSFNEYGRRFVDPAFGFAMGWNYWMNWAFTLPIETTALAAALNFWVQDSFPSWAMSLVITVFLFLVNCIGVRAYGEIEFVLSIMKILAICVFIVAGIAIVIKDHTGFSNYQVGDGPIPNGVMGILGVFVNIIFAYGGTELVGITAGEAGNPKQSVPKAINGTFWRIVIFYVCSIFVIGLILPYTSTELASGGESVALSPFTLGFVKLGIPGAPHIMNAVICVAILSAGNSSMYAASRTLMALSFKKQAPAIFGHVTKHGVPIAALCLSFLFGMIALIGKFVGNGDLFNILMGLNSMLILITWLGILVTHIFFRRAYLAQGLKLEDLPYRAPFFPIPQIFGILFGIVIIIVYGINEMGGSDNNKTKIVNMVTGYIMFVVFALLFVVYKLVWKTQLVDPKEADFVTGHVDDVPISVKDASAAMTEVEKGASVEIENKIEMN